MATFRKIPCAGIYTITTPAGTYVGQSKDCFSRWQSHYKDLYIKRHSSPKLQKAFDEFGIDAFQFQIVAKVSRQEKEIKKKLLELEKKVYADCLDSGMNLLNAKVLSKTRS